MSLLMQALKKAEDAKQKQDVASPREELRMEPMGTSPATPQDAIPSDAIPLEATPPADELGFPKISPPLSEGRRAEPELPPAKAEPLLDFAPAEPPSAPREEPPAAVRTPPQPPIAVEPRVSMAGQTGPGVKAPDSQPFVLPQDGQRKPEASPSAARETAKAVFASKQRSKGRRDVWIGAALIAVVAMSGIGYYVWQGIMPRSNVLYAGHALPPAPEASPLQPPPAVQASSATVQPAVEASARQPVAGEAATAIDKPTAAPTGLPPPKAPSATPRTSATMVAEEANAASAPIQIHAGHSENRIDPMLTNAYDALLAGDLDSAQRKYQAVLQQEANNRDGLLGMAAIAVRRNQPDQAERYYVKLLELDPLDPDATAGLIGMQQGDLSQSESRIKKVLAQHPQAGALWFALGNVYAQQSRWAEAQQAYFRAFGNQPGNADYAFNLAVSLDRLGQDKLALEYYQQALKLMHAGPANFGEASVQDRIAKLQSSLKN